MMVVASEGGVEFGWWEGGGLMKGAREGREGEGVMVWEETNNERRSIVLLPA